MEPQKQSNERHPNLFIVGVAKGGTTAWADYLNQHPDVFMSLEQRPNFFGDYWDINSRYYNTPEKYLSLFKGATNQKYLGEASHILNSIRAPNQIKAFSPNSKIIIILRNPVDVLRSNLDSGGYKTVPELIFTLKELLYYDNIKRWIKVFGQKNVYVMLFDDYVKDVKKEYRKVCDFLAIDNTFEPVFERLNYSSTANYPFYFKILFSIYNKLPFIFRKRIKYSFGHDKKQKIQRFYRKFDGSKVVHTEIPKDDKEMIYNAFFKDQFEKALQFVK